MKLKIANKTKQNQQKNQKQKREKKRRKRNITKQNEKKKIFKTAKLEGLGMDGSEGNRKR